VEQGTANAYLHAVYALGLKQKNQTRIFKGWKTLTDNDFYKLPYQMYRVLILVFLKHINSNEI
jgi:hypothetical protein